LTDYFNKKNDPILSQIENKESYSSYLKYLLPLSFITRNNSQIMAIHTQYNSLLVLDFQKSILLGAMLGHDCKIKKLVLTKQRNNFITLDFDNNII